MVVKSRMSEVRMPEFELPAFIMYLLYSPCNRDNSSCKDQMRSIGMILAQHQEHSPNKLFVYPEASIMPSSMNIGRLNGGMATVSNPI